MLDLINFRWMLSLNDYLFENTEFTNKIASLDSKVFRRTLVVTQYFIILVPLTNERLFKNFQYMLSL